MKKSVEISLLIFICLLGIGLRFYRLDSAPRGATIDEVHYGYLAYSLLETGKDEHGASHPLIFKGFGDDKLPLQAYALVPFVKFFGLNNSVIRFPSIVAGMSLILIAYLLAKELGLSKQTSLLTSLIVAISPWSFFLSRFGYESNLGLAIFSFALYCGIKGLKNKRVSWIYWSSVLSGLTWYAYIAFRPISVIFVLLFTYLFFKKTDKLSKGLFGIIIIFVLTISPLLLPNNIDTNTTRFKQVGILSDPGLALEVNENRTFCSEHLPDVICYAAFNKPLIAIKKLSSRYFYTVGFDFLFLEGEVGVPMMAAKGFAQFFLTLIPFYILGISVLINKKSNLSTSLKLILIVGLLLSPIPAVLVGDVQKVRVSVLFPFVLMLIAMGTEEALKIIKSALNNFAVGVFIVLLLVSLSVESFMYYSYWFGVHTSKNSQVYQSYMPEMTDFITSHPDAKINIIPFFSDPLMFFAYYSKFNPSTYQKEVVLGELEDSGFQHAVKLGRLSAYETSIEEFSCSLKEGEDGYFMTNQEFLRSKEEYRVMTDNGVDTIFRVYGPLKYSEESC